MEITMLNIIKQRQPFLKAKYWLIIVTLTLIAVFLSSCGLNCNNQYPSEEYNTKTDALQAYYLYERNMDVSKKDLSEMTLTNFRADENYFYLMKEHMSVDNKDVPFVYVLGVAPTKKKWFYEKVTADFSLASSDDVNDSEYTPYAEYEIPIADKLIHVGIVFDDSYTPIVDGEHISVDKDGIYCYISSKAIQKTEYIHGEKS